MIQSYFCEKDQREDLLDYVAEIGKFYDPYYYQAFLQIEFDE